jgi:hypothetical protein
MAALAILLCQIVSRIRICIRISLIVQVTR